MRALQNGYILVMIVIHGHTLCNNPALNNGEAKSINCINRLFR